MTTYLTIEACVEKFDEAMLALKNGANQLEICSDLANDGLTPDLKFIESLLRVEETRSCCLKIMIRCRSGDFVYDSKEISKVSWKRTFF